MPLTSKEMCRLLEQNGFVCIRSNGSHRMYSNPVTKKSIVVPYHAKDLKPGLEKSILKQAGIKK